MHKVMALDVGTKRIGIALSDYLQVIATPHSFISRVPEEKAIADIVKIAKENRVEKIVVGVPINMDGTFGGQAKDCQDFSQKNKKCHGFFWRIWKSMEKSGVRKTGCFFRPFLI